jgi:hypothetical protein
MRTTAQDRPASAVAGHDTRAVAGSLAAGRTHLSERCRPLVPPGGMCSPPVRTIASPIRAASSPCGEYHDLYMNSPGNRSAKQNREPRVLQPLSAVGCFGLPLRGHSVQTQRRTKSATQETSTPRGRGGLRKVVRRLGHRFDLGRFPGFVEERRKWAVKPKDRKPPFVRVGLNPVAAFNAVRLLRAEPDRGAPIVSCGCRR